MNDRPQYVLEPVHQIRKARRNIPQSDQTGESFLIAFSNHVCLDRRGHYKVESGAGSLARERAGSLARLLARSLACMLACSLTCSLARGRAGSHARSLAGVRARLLARSLAGSHACMLAA